jgi:hypothetical protein
MGRVQPISRQTLINIKNAFTGPNSPANGNDYIVSSYVPMSNTTLSVNIKGSQNHTDAITKVVSNYVLHTASIVKVTPTKNGQKGPSFVSTNPSTTKKSINSSINQDYTIHLADNSISGSLKVNN